MTWTPPTPTGEYVSTPFGTPGVMGSRGGGVKGGRTFHRTDCPQIAHKIAAGHFRDETVASARREVAMKKRLGSSAGYHAHSCIRFD